MLRERHSLGAIRDAVALGHSAATEPRSCGKMNHIQWLALLPAVSSARTRP